MIAIPHYIDPRFDRAARHRNDADWLAAQLTASATRLVPVWRSRNLVGGPPGSPAAILLPGDLPGWRERAGEIVLLGVTSAASGAGDSIPTLPFDAGPAGTAPTSYVAVDFSAVPDPAADPVLGGLGRFVDLRAVGPLLARADGALLAQARAVTWWHQRHLHCGVCGSLTESRAAGHQRRCLNPACAAEHFPRTDPAVIMLIHDGGERCMLGRQKSWPAGMHSVLAGFVEPGESLEGCVAREVHEEAGIPVTDIRYFGSQPWPFPQSLMVAFTARAAGFDLHPDPDELEHLAWYQRDWLIAQAATPIGTGAFALPRRDSIARVMLDHWLGVGP